MVKIGLIFGALAFVGVARWEQHDYSAGSSGQIAGSIKSKLLNSISLFADQTFAKKLQDDLNNDKDSTRQLKEISSANAAQVFSILGLYDPGCDKNGDRTINGNELKCLNYAWKAYVPK